MKSDFATDFCIGFVLRYLPYYVFAIDMHKNTNPLMINFCLQKNVATSIFLMCKLIYWLSIYILWKLLLVLQNVLIRYTLRILYHNLDKRTAKFLGHRSMTLIEWKTLNNLVKHLAIQIWLQKKVSPFFCTMYT